VRKGVLKEIFASYESGLIEFFERFLAAVAGCLNWPSRSRAPASCGFNYRLMTLTVLAGMLTNRLTGEFLTHRPVTAAGALRTIRHL
jgi:hypothetical protein